MDELKGARHEWPYLGHLTGDSHTGDFTMRSQTKEGHLRKPYCKDLHQGSLLWESNPGNLTVGTCLGRTLLWRNTREELTAEDNTSEILLWEAHQRTLLNLFASTRK